jgi:hypothetical protein
MPITIAWDDPDDKTTLLYTIKGRWTWEEFYAAIYEGRGLMDSISKSPIHSIVDISQGRLFPSNALSHFARMSTTRHPKAGLMVMVGMGSFVKALMNMLSRYRKGSTSLIRVAENLDEARRLLAEYDETTSGVA